MAHPILAFSLIGALATFVAAQSSVPPLAERLAGYRWQRRVLLVITPTLTDARYRQQLDWLRDQTAALAERDLTVVTVEAAADRAWTQQTYGVGEVFGVVLLGKDGGAKLRSDQPVVPAALYATVDAMPMRQAEQRRAGKKPGRE